MDIPAFVVTTRARRLATARLDSPFVTDGIESAVARAKSAADPKSVGVHGAQTIQQCLDAGLLDEIHIDLAAVLLGAGVRLFDHLANTGRPRESDSRHRCGCHASALSRADVVDLLGTTCLGYSASFGGSAEIPEHLLSRRFCSLMAS